MTGSWAGLDNQPSFGAGTMLLLTDGTVMCHESSTPRWWNLQPDPSGSYSTGTWSKLADGLNAPLYFASAVMRDGRVFTAGGEFNNGVQADLLAAQIFDPRQNRWQTISTPAGWSHIGDAACCMLADGRILLGCIDDNRCAIYDPQTDQWSDAGSKQNQTSDEETWTLLPDDSVMTADCTGAPQTERYLAAIGKWVPSGSTPAKLVEESSTEIGPAIVLPDGRLFAIGATGNTAIYTMASATAPNGTWAAGPMFPNHGSDPLGAKDAPACLLPNGTVLCVAGPVDGVSQDYKTPTYFFEYDPATNSILDAPTPSTSGGPPYTARFLLLPSGQVLFANGSSNIQIYTPSGAPQPSWKPKVTSVPGNLPCGGTFTLYGQQINGLSQAVSYGDDATMATNYPIVRLRHSSTGQITYCRTANHSTMGVATGSAMHHTEFTVPLHTQIGPSELEVVANGIASEPTPVTVTAGAPQSNFRNS